jgi:hypothetical protein
MNKKNLIKYFIFFLFISNVLSLPEEYQKGLDFFEKFLEGNNNINEESKKKDFNETLSAINTHFSIFYKADQQKKLDDNEIRMFTKYIVMLHEYKIKMIKYFTKKSNISLYDFMRYQPTWSSNASYALEKIIDKDSIDSFNKIWRCFYKAKNIALRKINPKTLADIILKIENCSDRSIAFGIYASLSEDHRELHSLFLELGKLNKFRAENIETFFFECDQKTNPPSEYHT